MNTQLANANPTVISTPSNQLVLGGHYINQMNVYKVYEVPPMQPFVDHCYVPGKV